jgi:hypothetical protein
MRNAQRLPLIGFVSLAVVVGCLAQETKTDYDRNANFNRYKTFSFEKIDTKDPLWIDRIAAAVGGTLTAKGLKQVALGGDIAIVAIGMEGDRNTLDSFYGSFPGGWAWRWGLGDGEATATTETYEVGTLVVDIFDRKTKALVWRGSITNTLSNNSTKNIVTLDKCVKKLFKEFPPKT